MIRWQLAHGRHLDLGGKAVLMGILNVTPDSFSDGGEFFSLDLALEQARRMIDEGAAIIDVGGQSTRPGAEPVSPEEEQVRIMPVIEALTADGRVLISVDTYRAETARLAVAAGAHIVNDVHGLQREPFGLGQGGAGRDADLAAALAVDLDRQDDLLVRGQGRVELGPRGVHHQAFAADAEATVKSIGEVADDDLILDIGSQTGARYAQLIADAGTVVWNGPVGVFEFDAFAGGTGAVARAIAGSKAFSIAGGGDTLAAVDKFGIEKQVSYISTGGGAFLEFLEGKTLPAVAALDARGG